MYSLYKSWECLIDLIITILPISCHGLQDLRPFLIELFVEKSQFTTWDYVSHWPRFIVLMICPLGMKILNEKQLTDRSSEESSDSIESNGGGRILRQYSQWILLLVGTD